MADSILPVRSCVKCGATDFNSYGRCKACKRIAAASYRAENPDKAKEYKKAWEAAHIDKRKLHTAAYRTANHEKVIAATVAWRAANQDKVKAYRTAYRAANPEKAKASATAWHAANPEARRINQQNRNARKRANGGTLSKGLSQKLFKLQRGKCACCGLPLGDKYHLDHRMPVTLDGPNTDDNMQLLRSTCNQQKSAKHPIDFMQSRGFLL